MCAREHSSSYCSFQVKWETGMCLRTTIDQRWMLSLMCQMSGRHEKWTFWRLLGTGNSVANGEHSLAQDDNKNQGHVSARAEAKEKKNRRGRKARAKRRDAAAARATLRLRISIFRIRNVLSRSQQTQTHTQLPPFNIKNSLSTTFGQKVSSCDGCSDKIGLDCFGLWASPQKAPGMWGETRNKLGPSASLLPEGLGKGPTVLNRFHRFFGHKSIRKTVFSSG